MAGRSSSLRYLFLLLLLLTAHGGIDLSAQAEADWAAWQGDKELFNYEEGLLSYIDNDVAGKAHLYRDFTFQPDDEVTWQITTRFLSPPTSQNRFSLYLFSRHSPNYEYQYTVAPGSDNQSVHLFAQVYSLKEGKRADFVTQRHLTKIELKHSFFVWKELLIRAIYAPSHGLQLQLYSSYTGLQSSDWVEIDEGITIARMGLRTQFTSRKKLEHAWVLPTVQIGSENIEAKRLSLVEAVPEEIGRLHIRVNMFVDVSKAEVKLLGHAPTITRGSSLDTFTIELGRKFEAGKTYTFDITNILDTRGNIHSLSIEVETKAATPSTTTVPTGLFFTEIMASPPDTGPLRHTKYIEIYNNTATPLPLATIILQYRSTKYELPNTTISPGNLAILYPYEEPAPNITSGILVPMERFPALSGSFILRLTDGDRTVYDEVSFSSRLYGEGVERGGASVERVGYLPNVWRRSDHPDGGTPGALTTMKLHQPIPAGAIIINEVMLSPGSTGERYLEFYNTTEQPLDLSSLYLAYSNKAESAYTKSWLPVTKETIIKPHSFIVVSPYPEALSRIYESYDHNTFVERIDFPSLSSTYTELELRAHTDDTLVDKAVYRRQWLGATSHDRTGFSLERVGYHLDGTLRSSWRRALGDKGGGTPGIVNSVFGLPPLEPNPDSGGMTWPEEPELSYEQFQLFCQSYPRLLTLYLYSLDGTPLYSGTGEEAITYLQSISRGEGALPTTLIVVQAYFHHPDATLQELYYHAKWLHIKQ